MAYQPPFVGSIDQGTSSTRFILFDNKGKIALSHQVEFEQKYPEPGYVNINHTYNKRECANLIIDG